MALPFNIFLKPEFYGHWTEVRLRSLKILQMASYEATGFQRVN